MIKQYTNGNCIVKINLNTGTKERFTEDDTFIPEFAESMDVTITNKCDGLCEFCYAGCTRDGKHADLLSDYVVNTFVPSLKPYTELALNGNDLSHPQLEKFLILLKENDIIANLTVNQRHFMQNTSLLKKWSDEKLIHGLGVSLNDSKDKRFVESLRLFPNAILHVINGLFTPEDIINLQDKDIKLLILGYKKKNRGVWYHEKYRYKLDIRSSILENLLPAMIKLGKFEVISFDNLAIQQLHVKNILSEEQWEEFYMGDDGSFTFYVDLVNNIFSKNSLEDNVYNIMGRDATEMFNFVRSL